MGERELELLAALQLCDKDDPTLLTRTELKRSWGGPFPCTNFMLSYGLKPWNPEDIDEAVAISRALKGSDDDQDDEESNPTRLKIWTDGAAKENNVAGIGRVAGVGVVFGESSLPKLYGPVEFNLTEKATNNAAELQAAILGLEKAKEEGFHLVEMNTDSQFLKNVMTDWIDKWKAKGWKKSDGKKPLKISVDLVKKLDNLRTEMDITWQWLPRNSCDELVLADALANHGCLMRHQAQEMELNKLFRRTVYDRRLSYPDSLPPTVLRTKEKVLIPQGETVTISCTLDILERLKKKLIETKASISTLSSDQAYGLVICLRTFSLLAGDGTVAVQCHTLGSEFVGGKIVQPTLVLPEGSVVGVGYSFPFDKGDGLEDKSLMGMLFFTDINM